MRLASASLRPQRGKGLVLREGEGSNSYIVELPSKEEREDKRAITESQPRMYEVDLVKGIEDVSLKRKLEGEDDGSILAQSTCEVYIGIYVECVSKLCICLCMFMSGMCMCNCRLLL